ncbi:MAG: hypothetical protein ACREEX_04080, partial [Caulobacteraceae bacterium]
MTDSHGARARAPIGQDFGAVDLKAMPKVLRRIVSAALAIAPRRVAAAFAASLGAAAASLTLPKLYGHA